MNPFSQRSSLPSAFLTGLIGWIGWMFIGPLIFGIPFPAKDLLLIAVLSAVVQVSLLRILFFALRMHRRLLIGAFWGLATAIGLYYAARYFYPALADHPVAWLLTYAYIGAPVGGFLSYFYIDDKKIFDATGGQTPDTKFGRDAHWMEPFGFGVIAYLVSFFPFRHFDLTVNVIIVGAISGVGAAGASHFSPDRWKRSLALLSLIIIVVGGLQGALSGLMFRAYAGQLPLGYVLHGLIGGVITYLMTFSRGRQLAAKEESGEL